MKGKYFKSAHKVSTEVLNLSLFMAKVILLIFEQNVRNYLFSIVMTVLHFGPNVV